MTRPLLLPELKPLPAETLDAAYLEELRVSAGSECRALMEELLAAFGQERPAQEVALSEACARRDAQALATVIHRMGGGAANMGFLRLAFLCREVEQMAREGQWKSFEALPGTVREEMDRGIHALTQWVAGLG